jgi:hypothetical protein
MGFLKFLTSIEVVRGGYQRPLNAMNKHDSYFEVIPWFYPFKK